MYLYQVIYLAVSRDVVNIGYDSVTTTFSHENCSKTKPKLNKTGNKLTILNELQLNPPLSK